MELRRATVLMVGAVIAEAIAITLTFVIIHLWNRSRR